MRIAIALILIVALPALAAPPSAQRIVSLAPVITEILFAVGAGQQVVGVTRYCDRPVAVQKLAKIGGLIDPQLESILALKPDLVIGMPIPPHQTLLEQLRHRGVSVQTVPSNTIEEIRQSMLNIGTTTTHLVEARSFLKHFDQKISSLKNALRCPRAPTVLLTVATAPLVVAGPNTFADESLTLIGAKSAVPRGAPSWPLWSVEHIAKQPPNVVIAMEGKTSLPALKTLLQPIQKQIKKTVVLASDKAILQRPGPHLAEDIQQLIELIRTYEPCRTRI